MSDGLLAALPPASWWLLLALALALPTLFSRSSRRALWSAEALPQARRWLITAFAWSLLGVAASLVMRWKLAYPGERLPFGHELLFGSASGETTGITPEHYNASLSFHGTLMVFWVVIPAFLGGMGLGTVPLQLRRVRPLLPWAGPLAYGLAWASFLCLLWSLLCPGEGAAAGWTAYPPLAAWLLGPGMGAWCLALLGMGSALTLMAASVAATILFGRPKGLSPLRFPMTVWSLFTSAWLMLLATPVLLAGTGLLLSDLVAGTGFFLPTGSLGATQAPPGAQGSPLAWQHLFWFWAHPAVYVMVLPGMGLVSDLFAKGSGRAPFLHRSSIAATLAIGGLGFVVWGHHMFQSGLDPRLERGFALATMLIAVPSGVKLVSWIGTLRRSRRRLEPAFVAALAFVSMFVVGGLSGVALASRPWNIQLHDTHFVVAHLHYVVFGASAFGAFAALYTWWPTLFGGRPIAWLAQLHLFGSLLAFNATFWPLHSLGLSGAVRRLADPYVESALQGALGTNRFVTSAAIVLALCQGLLLLNLLLSALRRLRRGRESEASEARAKRAPADLRGEAGAAHLFPGAEEGEDRRDSIPAEEKRP